MEALDLDLAHSPNAGAVDARRPRASERSISEQGHRWVLNRCASAKPIRARNGLVFQLNAPVPGIGLRRLVVSRKNHPEVFGFLCDLCQNDVKTVTALPASLQERLVSIGLVVPAPGPTRPLFSCPFNERELTPSSRLNLLQSFRRATDDPSDSQIADLPLQWIRREDTTICWMADEESGVSWPVWLTQRDAAALECQPALSDWQVASPASASSAWSVRMETARRELEERGYTIVEQLVPEHVLGGLNAYYAALVQNGFLVNGDEQSRRHNLHNEPVTCWLHRHTKPLVDRIIPERVTCSYTYLGFYMPGSALDRHTDREQCEYTLSLAIRAEPSARREDAWPLYLELPDSSHVANLLAPGDAIVFKGRVLPHFRETLQENRVAWFALLHFVPTSFCGNFRSVGT